MKYLSFVVLVAFALSGCTVASGLVSDVSSTAGAAVNLGTTALGTAGHAATNAYYDVNNAAYAVTHH